MTAGVAEKMVRIGMEGKGEETGWAEGLPAAIFTDSKRSGATAVMKN